MTGADGSGTEPMVRGDLSSPWRWLLVGATLAPVLWLTLTPAADHHVVGRFLLCLFCGTFGSANLARNVVLFVPLGASLALLLGPRRWAFLTVLAITATIETLQLHIPGRNPMVEDIVMNFTGGALSILLVRWAPWWVRPPRSRGAGLSLISAAATASVVVATAFLFSVDLPESSWWGQWTPDLGHLERYEGRVLAASVDGIPTPSRRLDDPQAVRSALLEGGTARVEALAGPPPPGIAPIFSVFDQERREILLLGADGDDLVGRIRYRADRLRFDRPDLRVRGALVEVEAGDRIALELRVGDRDACLGLNGRETCGLGPGFERGWALLMFPGSAPAWLHRLLDFAWMAALMVPVAFFARPHPLTALGALGLIGGLALGWWWAPPSLIGAQGAILGFSFGLGLGWAARRS